MADIITIKILDRVFLSMIKKTIQSFIFISNTTWLLAEAKQPSTAYSFDVHITLIPLTSTYKSTLKTLKISFTSITQACCAMISTVMHTKWKRAELYFPPISLPAQFFPKDLERYIFPKTWKDTHVYHLTHEKSHWSHWQSISNTRSLGN